MIQVARCQLMDNSHGNAMEDEWLFNSAFIAANGICQIRVEHSIKPDGFEIEKTGDVSIYQFDPQGETVAHQKISSLFGRADTTNISQRYGQSQLQSIRYSTRRSIITDTLIYQDSNVTIIRFKQDLTGHLRRIKVNSESRNTTWPNDTTKILLSRNDLGLPYYRETWIWTNSGYLSAYKSEFIISGDRNSIHYGYDKFARIAERISTENQKITKEKFQYDRWGNLEKVIRQVNGERTNTQELLLSANGLPEAILSRRERSEEIVISKLFYRYCE
ncbi:MAG: hypothetical protein ACI84C_002030 [Flavobacteriales bacterium]